MRLLFLGDSLVEFCNWQGRFPLHTAVNGGRAGETVAGLLAELPMHLHRCPEPERVFLMIGTNNLLREEYGFLPDYEKILATLGQILPPEKITITSLPPIQARHLAPLAISRLNESLLQLSREKKAGFLDLFTAFNTAPQTVAACFSEDGVHFSPLGYEIWSACLARTL
ncbi:GDSL-type esterase/lipase family protein [Thiovibrio frasassiensis]|uniref:GDSL-type esterase/lipase family protein n=1 Tax=Thiovibrio frasassiensis TaxID=2984131 RepID=A0A9X4MF89_9BACT|nr:GDSL-type esterase/lipase family protein [Thiovibrio frasassiensis]MDG4475080.1 GDSL-type esterase/lipase family protein [Thiovibrio frasassiensis]